MTYLKTKHVYIYYLCRKIKKYVGRIVPKNMVLRENCDSL
jgi:hypothetical protein